MRVLSNQRPRCGTHRFRRLAITAVLLIPGLPSAGAAADRTSAAGVETGFSVPASFSPAWWDSLEFLRKDLGSISGSPAAGACLRDEQDLRFYEEGGRRWSEHSLSRILAIEDPSAWTEAETGPDILLPADAGILRTTITVLGAGGARKITGNEARRLDPAEDPPCLERTTRLRLRLPSLQRHSLLRWEVVWREPTATTRAVHWFGGNHSVLETRFSFLVPRSYLDTDWAEFTRAVGSIPKQVGEDRVGPRKDHLRFTYRERSVSPRTIHPYSPPRSDLVSHLLFLPEPAGPDRRAGLLTLCGRIDSAAVLDEATRAVLLAPILSRTSNHAEQAILLRDRVAAQVRRSALPLEVQDGTVRRAPRTWSEGCGSAVDIAALLIAGFRELGLQAEPLLSRSAETATVDTAASDVSEFDRVLVAVEPEGGVESKDIAAILDVSCPLCPWGSLRADLQGQPAIGMVRSAMRWRTLPAAPARSNRLRRVVVLQPQPGAAERNDSPPPFRAGIEWTAYGEVAIILREGGDLPAPGGAVLPQRPAAGSVRRPGPAGDQQGAVAFRDTMSIEAERHGDGWRLPESPLGREGLLASLQEIRSADPIGPTIALPYTVVLEDSSVIVLPTGWTATALPESTDLPQDGYHLVTRARLEAGRVVLISRLELERTRYAGQAARDLADLAWALRAKDTRGVILGPIGTPGKE